MKYLRILICLVLSLCIIFTCGGCVKTEKLNWAMNASLISWDAQVQQTFSLTISGPIIHKGDETTMEFNILFSDDTGLEYRLPKTGKYTDQSMYLGINDYYIWYASLLDKTSGNSIDAVFALHVDQQLLMIYQRDVPDPYIVASTDPNVDAQAILEHFAEFLQLYSFDS